MAIIGDSNWVYYQVWEDIHDAMELLVDVKAQLPELEESNSIVNNIIYPKLIEASMKIGKASNTISALTTEDTVHDKPIQELNDFVQVKTDDFLFQNIALSLAIHVAAIASSCSVEEIKKGIEINAKQSVDSLSIERKIAGINDYYKESKNEQ